VPRARLAGPEIHREPVHARRGADYLADAIGVSLLAIRLAARPPSYARPGGYPLAIAVIISYLAQELVRQTVTAIRSP
jgi:hypothetical protein